MVVKADRVGLVYGRLTVLSEGEPVRMHGRKYVTWNCQCACGKLLNIKARQLGKGTLSCGCLPADQLSERRWKGHGDISGRYWQNLNRNAKVRGHAFEISIEHAYQVFLDQKGLCALSGLPIKFSQRREASTGTASLDRIDSSVGYVEGNIQWVHKEVNLMKGSLTEERFLYLCELISERNSAYEG